MWHLKSITTALSAWIWIGHHLRAKEQWNEIEKNKDIFMGSAKRPMLEKVKTCKLYESRLTVQKLFVVAMNT